MSEYDDVIHQKNQKESMIRESMYVPLARIEAHKFDQNNECH